METQKSSLCHNEFLMNHVAPLSSQLLIEYYNVISYHQPEKMGVSALSHPFFHFFPYFCKDPLADPPVRMDMCTHARALLHCCPSHWNLTHTWWCFSAVRNWGGSLLWFLHKGNWTSWNVLVRLLCYYYQGEWATWNYCKVDYPRMTPWQNIFLYVIKIYSCFFLLSARFCQSFYLFFIPHLVEDV